eukprot:Transcript_19170.p2 GENE.Transcript_19170~~Transcript_19170.p2  ORF type:complete len:174 (-),score=72.09 Transcript_19170:782-1303(-)
MLRRLSLLLASLPCLLAEPCEDSPALTTIWESTSTGNSDRLIDALIQNRDFAKHRSGDCRGPLFWAFEFKNVDALALYMHFGIALDQADNDGKSPKEFFDGSEDDLQEFLGEAKSKVEELSTLLAEREEEFYSFKSDGEDDYDDENEATDGVDNIDYADEEDDEEPTGGKDEM